MYRRQKKKRKKKTGRNRETRKAVHFELIVLLQWSNGNQGPVHNLTIDISGEL
jgi:hypothetical protein